eukprot:824187-Prymnesium_polylepis.1
MSLLVASRHARARAVVPLRAPPPCRARTVVARRLHIMRALGLRGRVCVCQRVTTYEDAARACVSRGATNTNYTCASLETHWVGRPRGR